MYAYFFQRRVFAFLKKRDIAVCLKFSLVFPLLKRGVKSKVKVKFMSKENEDIELITNSDDIKIGISEVSTNVLQLLGEILTIIDASTIDDRHNKAIKDLIKDKFYKRNGKLTKSAIEQFGIDWDSYTRITDDITEEEIINMGVSEKEKMDMSHADSSHL